MPEISRFFGIVITMYFNDHEPPHFLVHYGDYRAVITLEPLELTRGHLPPRVFGLVNEWAQLHLAELRDNWTQLSQRGTFAPIAPLE
jgi:hypothetical protein